MKIRYGGDRGTANFGWLDSRHTFSFGGYYDPEHMGFSSLRVINEDRVEPGRGFGTHPHRDMEIISYVLSGALEHRDSIGNGSTIRPGDVQRISAGTGILHSEFNASQTDPVHFLQIWIVPDRPGLRPSYEQKTFSEAEKRGKLQLVGSPDGRGGSVRIHQDVNLYVSSLKYGETVRYSVLPGRAAWVQIVRGSVKLGDRDLTAGDGVALRETDVFTLAGMSDTAEVLIFDLAAPIDLSGFRAV